MRSRSCQAGRGELLPDAEMTTTPAGMAPEWRECTDAESMEPRVRRKGLWNAAQRTLREGRHAKRAAHASRDGESYQT